MNLRRVLYVFVMFVCLSTSFAQDENRLLTNLEVITPDNLDRLEPLMQLGCGAILDVEWSHDMQTVYFSTSRGLFIYSTVDFSIDPQVISIEGLEEIDIDSTGQYLIADSRIWDMSDWSHPIKDWGDDYHIEFIGQDTLRLLVRGQDANEIWDVQTLSQLAILPSKIENPIFSPNGLFIVTQPDREYIAVFDGTTFELLSTLSPDSPDQYHLIKFSEDNQFLVTWGNQRGPLNSAISYVNIWRTSDFLTHSTPDVYQRVEIYVDRSIDPWVYYTGLFYP